MGGLANVVVNTIVRMFTRRATGKTMRSAKKTMGARKGNASGRHNKNGNAKDKKIID